MISVLLTKKIISLFLIMLAGSALVKTNIAKTEDSKILSLVSMYLVLPAVIIGSFQVADANEIKEGLLLAFYAAIAIHILLLAFSFLAKHIFSLGNVELASIIYSNAGALIIPIVTGVLGKEWLVYTCAFISVQTALIWSHCRSLLCKEDGFDLKKIILNINMICVFLGVIIFLCKIPFPALLKDTLSTLSEMAGPLSMIITGMIIAGTNFEKYLFLPRMWLILTLRLIIVPLIAIAFFIISGIGNHVPHSDKILLISLLATTTSSAAIIPQLAQLNGQDAAYASAINVLSTLCCIITMPPIVALYQKLIYLFT